MCRVDGFFRAPHGTANLFKAAILILDSSLLTDISLCLLFCYMKSKMSGKNARSGKGASRPSSLTDTSANASRNQASSNSPGRSSAENEGELPLAWHKVSNMLLQSFIEPFHKFQQSFQNILAAQRELTERLTTTEGQAADHEQRIHAVETSITELQQENKRLRAKLSDLEERSKRNNIRILGIPEGE